MPVHTKEVNVPARSPVPSSEAIALNLNYSVFGKIPQTGVCGSNLMKLKANSNLEPANSSRIWLLKTPIHVKGSIKKGGEELYCLRSELSRSFYPLGHLAPSAETSLEDLLQS